MKCVKLSFHDEFCTESFGQTFPIRLGLKIKIGLLPGYDGRDKKLLKWQIRSVNYKKLCTFVRFFQKSRRTERMR